VLLHASTAEEPVDNVIMKTQAVYLHKLLIVDDNIRKFRKYVISLMVEFCHSVCFEGESA
jgi:hypothetical protein